MKEIESPLQDNGGSLSVGQFYAANESRLVEANFSEPLTSYAVGWRDENEILDSLNFVAPEVQTTRRFEYAKAVNAEEFYSDGTGNQDVRAIGGDFKAIEFTSEKENNKTLNKGLTIRVDMDNVAGMSNWREVYTRRILKRLYRNELRRAYALLEAAAVSGGTKAWSTTGTPLDPDQDVATELLAARADSGVRANRVVFNDIAWNKRRLMHRASATSGGFASAGMTPEEVAGYLGVSGVKVMNEIYIAVGGTTKAKVASDKVIAFNAESGLTTEDPSNIKRFTSPTMGGTAFRVYEQQVNAKLVDITVEHYSHIIVTSTLGIRSLTIT